MDNEKYGIELELLTSKLKQQANAFKGYLKKFSNDVKKETSVNFTLDSKLNEKQLNNMIQEAKEKLKELKESANMGKVMGIVDKKEELKIKNLSALIKMATERIKELNEEKNKTEMKKMNIETNEVSNSMNKMGNSIKNAFDKSTAKMKRFALSLFSIRSIWSLVSRASSNYLAQDQQLSNQITRTWSSLGALLSPVIEKIVQGFRTLIAYVNYFVKALTGKDFIAKAVKKINTYNKSLNKTSKSAKGLNKELTSLDEVTNLSFDDASTTGIDDAAEGLDDFSDIKLDKNVTNILDSWAKSLKEVWKNLKPVRDTLKKVIDWAVKNPDTVLKILGGAVMLKTLSTLTGTGGLGTLASLLKPLATIGVVVAGVDLIYNAVTGRDLINDLKEIINDLKDLGKMTKDNLKNTEGNVEITNDLVKSGKKVIDNNKKGSKEIDKYSKSLNHFNTMSMNQIENFQKQISVVGNFTGKNKTLIQSIKNVISVEKKQTDSLYYMYKQNKMTDDQQKDYQKTLENQIEKYKRLKDNVVGNADLTKKYQDRITDLKNKLGELTAKDYACELTVDSETGTYKVKTLKDRLMEFKDKIFNTKLTLDTKDGQNKVKTLKDTINDFVKKKFNITISALFNGKEGKSKLSKFFTGVNKFAGSIKNAFGGVFKAVTTPISSLINKFLPSFDVGTNYVPNDMVAQIHKGEMIVPAKYNPMTSGIGGNEETNALLIELNRNILELSKRPNVLNVNGKEFAQATYNDFQNEGNRLNQSMTIKRS